jgi:hypothetical protein
MHNGGHLCSNFCQCKDGFKAKFGLDDMNNELTSLEKFLIHAHYFLKYDLSGQYSHHRQHLRFRQQTFAHVNYA